MSSRSSWLAVLLTATFFVSIAAQSGLPPKPFEQWSKSETEKLLSDSPWSQKQELRIRFDKERQKAAGSYSGVSESSAAQSQTEVNTQAPVDFIFTLRLRSALPIRQALVRMRNLETDIERMNQEQLAAFDKQSKGLLECPACENNYVVSISSKSTNTPGADAVFAAFKGGRLADLQRFIFISNEHGDRRPLVHFVAPRVPGDEATFFFSRVNDKGEPLLTPANKELLIHLSDNRPTSIGNFQFEVSKLMLSGKVEF